MTDLQYASVSSSDKAESEVLILFRNLSEQDRKDTIAYIHRLLDEQIAAATAEWNEE